MTFTNGSHPYNGKYNSRSQRQFSKISKGMKRRFLAKPRHFLILEWEKECPDFIHKFSYETDKCKACANYLCEKNI